MLNEIKAEKSQNSRTRNGIDFYSQQIIGYILLVPPLIGVFLFLKDLSDGYVNEIQTTDESFGLQHLSSKWTGAFFQGGFTSAAPIYLGLMAIAGALMIKNSKH